MLEILNTHTQAFVYTQIIRMCVSIINELLCYARPQAFLFIYITHIFMYLHYFHAVLCTQRQFCHTFGFVRGAIVQNSSIWKQIVTQTHTNKYAERRHHFFRPICRYPSRTLCLNEAASDAHTLYYTWKHNLTHLLHFYIKKMTTGKPKINLTPLPLFFIQH